MYHGPRGEVRYIYMYTECPRSSDQFYIVTYCVKLVTTSWTYCSTEGRISFQNLFKMFAVQIDEVRVNTDYGNPDGLTMKTLMD